MSSTCVKYHLLHLFQNTRGPMTIPKPKIYPSSTLNKFKLISPDFCVAKGGGAVPFVHFVTNGDPHNPLFPSYESFVNVANCFKNGISPTK